MDERETESRLALLRGIVQRLQRRWSDWTRCNNALMSFRHPVGVNCARAPIFQPNRPFGETDHSFNEPALARNYCDIAIDFVRSCDGLNPVSFLKVFEKAKGF